MRKSLVALPLLVFALACERPAAPRPAPTTPPVVAPATAPTDGAAGSSRLVADPAGDLSVIGLCEASGAAWVSDDRGGHLVVADDDQDRVLLEVRPSDAAGGQVHAQTAEFGWKMKDLEGLALDGAGDLWMSSSGSRKNSGGYDDGRQLLARWRPGLGGGPMARFRAGEDDGPAAVTVALQDPRCPGCSFPDGYDGRAPDAGGFNIEGLAALDGRLLFGLRSPQSAQGAAVLLEAKTPAHSGGLLAWSGAIALDLGGRGVRDLLWLADRGLLLVLAGPGASAVQGEPNVLFAWREGGTPRALGPIPDVGGGTPEAIAQDSGSGLWVLYDSGDAIKEAHGDAFECAELAESRPDLARTAARHYRLEAGDL